MTDATAPPLPHAPSLHLWGRLSSINVRKVVWTLQKLKQTFQGTEAGMVFGVVNTPAYQALNPNALVPTLQDGDLVLWESNAIVRYLCARYGANSPLYPADLPQPRPAWPHLSAWYARVLARPATRGVLDLPLS